MQDLPLVFAVIKLKRKRIFLQNGNFHCHGKEENPLLIDPETVQ
jgi:hypothetical protein